MRVIYFYHTPTLPTFLLTVYGKGEKDNLTPAARNTLRTVVETIVKTYEGKAQ